ncbi:hypothetical protein TSOC_001679 [Tetrabaena socialis]|uniref:Uncharacterized protein n=1 Tax=Tetrabaena socialis TaxID=47790 RepID=A0A2J8AG37_9CHLO|nr:hypothetical protein TSOC_001679 [Tetrabaena socialis]|eukprot:PNH11488.1 hypothetical protein TSOC_001679 [Tetrabaena socialis]
MRPLLREAAHMCLNGHVSWWYDDWAPGVLLDPRLHGTALSGYKRQPIRRLLAARGLQLGNPLSSAGGPTAALRAPAPRLDKASVQQLLGGMKGVGLRPSRRLRAQHQAALSGVMAARSAEARLLLPGSLPGRPGQRGELALVVCLDLSYGGEAVREAYERNVPSVSLLNGHSDASHVTYPVYAAEAHAGFQHFFLGWLLRVANVQPAKGPAAPPKWRGT